MLKRAFWLIVVAIGGWIAWQWFRQRQNEFSDTMPHFAPAYQYTPPASPAAIASEPPVPAASDAAPEPPAPAIAAHELDALFAEDASAPPAPEAAEAPAPVPAALADDVPTPPEPDTTDRPAPATAADGTAVSEIVGYCMRCRTKRPIQNAHEEISESGRRAARGTCPVCGTNMFVFLAAEDERGAAK